MPITIARFPPTQLIVLESGLLFLKKMPCVDCIKFSMKLNCHIECNRQVPEVEMHVNQCYMLLLKASVCFISTNVLNNHV